MQHQQNVPVKVAARRDATPIQRDRLSRIHVTICLLWGKKLMHCSNDARLEERLAVVTLQDLQGLPVGTNPAVAPLSLLKRLQHTLSLPMLYRRKLPQECADRFVLSTLCQQLSLM